VALEEETPLPRLGSRAATADSLSRYGPPRAVTLARDSGLEGEGDYPFVLEEDLDVGGEKCFEGNGAPEQPSEAAARAERGDERTPPHLRASSRHGDRLDPDRTCEAPRAQRLRARNPGTRPYTSPD